MRKWWARKRPCRICRRWFMPNPRLKDRQMTCGDPECKRERHRRKCREWNRKNSVIFRSNYLKEKLDVAIQWEEAKSHPDKSKHIDPPRSRLKSGLPVSDVQEVIGIEHLVIIEYLAQLIVQRFQDALRSQVIVNTGKLDRLVAVAFSRGNGH